MFPSLFETDTVSATNQSLQMFVLFFLLPLLVTAQSTQATFKIPRSFLGNLVMYNTDSKGNQYETTIGKQIPLHGFASASYFKNYQNFKLLQIDVFNASYKKQVFNYTQNSFVTTGFRYLQIAPNGHLVGVGRAFSNEQERRERTQLKFNDDGTITSVYRQGCIGSSIEDTSDFLEWNLLIFYKGKLQDLVQQGKCAKFVFRNPNTGKVAGNVNRNVYRWSM